MVQGLLDCPVEPVEPGNDNVWATVMATAAEAAPASAPYPATVLHVFARFSAPRSDSAKIV
jgi:hypothetical protein